MEKAIAVKMRVAHDALGDDLSKMGELTLEIADEAERLRYRTVIGRMMGDLWVEILAPIVREHPELDPDK